jgi:hypothetical protein|tara:strand:- start:5507 stop:5746 length:240 start_codon:yes stop_codon:yes gene_type:complete
VKNKNGLTFGKRLLQRSNIAKTTDFYKVEKFHERGIRTKDVPAYKFPTWASLGRCDEAEFETLCYGDSGEDINCWGEFV